MNLTLPEKIGQRLVVGFSGTKITEELEKMIREYKISNIILFKENIENGSQLKKLCSDLQKLIKEHTGIGAFITIDQEGGMVTRLAEDSVNIPGAMAIAATGETEYAYQAGKITGRQLKKLGVNFNLAPVVDINSNMDNPVIGVRSYGDSPEKVAEYAAAMTRGLLDGGVMASAKHFPGHGDTNIDSHLGLPQINKSLEELEKCELIPFKRVIVEGIPAITTAHILFPKIIDNKLPATMSREIVNDMLKEKMGFQGLVISDCMEMQAIQQSYGTIEGIKLAIKAGVDLIFISHTTRLVKDVSETLTKAFDSGELSMEEMDCSIDKILYWKNKFIDNSDTEIIFDEQYGKNYVSQLLKKSITPVKMPTKSLPELGQNPLFIGTLPFRATNVSNKKDNTLNFPKYMADRFGGRGKIISKDPDSTEIEMALEEVESYSTVVIGTYNGHLNKGQLELIKKVAVRNNKVIVLALRNPYDLKYLPENVYGIAVYEYTSNSLKVLAELFENPYEPEGKLPVIM
ncbi:beta-glucosidase [Vallitalea longa]|uniref:Beta-glucosidase n=1 Tax=Vallitalea longa TaxID=2936439 RepID=A0A9W5YFB9_9FIRM|nr:beta-N-acetylhexosaminidase [Vallitalea longa]GKX31268.1 beta-glucosidase [Vallitalea longa]